MRCRVVDGAVTTELRRQVLRPQWPVGSVMHGDDVPDAVHVAAFGEDGTLLAACVLFPAAYPGRPDAGGGWHLRGMATREDARGRGVGSRLLLHALREVAGRDGQLLWCDARESAIGFYARHGFVAEGERFVNPEIGIVHRRMYRELFDLPASSTS